MTDDGTTNRIELGGIGLGIARPLEWVVQRGFEPYTTTFQAPAHLREQLAGLPFRTTLSFVNGDKRQDIAVRLVEVAPVDWQVCMVTLADPRYDMARSAMLGDFNVRVRDEATPTTAGTASEVVQPQYLGGTSLKNNRDNVADIPHTLQSAMDKALTDFGDGWPVANAVSVAALESMPKKLTDNALTGGGSAADFYRDVLGPHGLGLVAREDGSVRIVGRTGVDLPDDLKAIAVWKLNNQPPWVFGEAVRKGIPKALRTPYAKRVALRASNEETISESPTRPALRLSQVYRSLSGRGFVGLTELIAERNDLMGEFASEITEQIIRDNIENREAGNAWEDTILQPWAGANVATIPGMTEQERAEAATEIVARIYADWRLLFRVSVPSTQLPAGAALLPQLGAYTDYAFGRVREVLSTGDEDSGVTDAGNVDPAQAVRCDWVDFLGGGISGLEGIDILGDAKSATNHTINDETPFVPVWEDYARGIVRLQTGESPGILSRRPGVVANEKLFSGIIDAEDLVTLSEQKRPARGIASKRMSGAATIQLYVVATQRVPQTESRWHMEAIDVDGGDLDETWTISTDVGKAAYYPLDSLAAQNAGAIKEDAQRRADRYIGKMRARHAGSGTADGLTAAGVEVDGIIESKTYRWRPPASIEVEIKVGAENEDDAETRERKARRRREQERRQTHSAQVISG